MALFYKGLSLQETRDVRAGDASFALLFERGVIFVLYKFGGQPWNAVPYSAWDAVPDGEAPGGLAGVAPRVDPYASSTDGRGGLKNVIEVHLVDTLTGLLMARRRFEMPEEFVLIFEEMVDEQVAAGAMCNEEFVAALESVFHHCEPEDMAARAVCLTIFRQRRRSRG